MCDGLVVFLDTVKVWVVIFRLCIYLIVEFYTVIPNNNVWDVSILFIIVYYESIKRELKIKPIYECRCDERLQTKTKRFTRLSYTGSRLRLIRKAEALTRSRTTLILSC